MTLTPILDHIVVKQVKPAEKQGSIFVPGAERNHNIFEVVSIGPDTTCVEPGNRIVMVPKGGIEFEFQGQVYLVITKESIVGVVS